MQADTNIKSIMQLSSKIILGVMSGTSLDGLDLCLCSFSEQKKAIKYEIIDSQTITYPKQIQSKLTHAHTLNSIDILKFHNEYGVYIGQTCKEFITGKPQPDFIASHGHTVFHQPDEKFTFQIGSGATIMAESGISTIVDFRTSDVAFNGQGAPLVPIGDKMLFSAYDYCVNIGGFANIFDKSKDIAYDICPANYVLNELTKTLGFQYDNKGEIAQNSSIDKKLLEQLNSISFYKQKPPKSLGREWVEAIINPTLNSYSISINDKIATYTEHIAIQIGECLQAKQKKALITGGGAYNNHLINRIKNYSESEVIIPSNSIIEFKEALIFALLGYLFINDQNNCLANITGANQSNIGGALYKHPKPKQ